MSPATLVLVLAGLVASTGLLAVLALAVYRETQRTIAFDRRLAVARRRAVAGGLWRERRARRGAGGGHTAQAFAQALLKAGSMLVPVGAAERAKLAQLLRKAGFGQRDALSTFLSVKLAAALVAGIGASLGTSDLELVAAHRFLGVVAGVAGLVVGGVLPEYVLRALVVRRSRRIAAALPDALDLMVMCLESGLTFERALQTVAEELRPIEPSLAGELRLLEAELRLGSDRRAVLQEFHDRTDIEGLRDLAMTLIQSERYGTPLSQSMKNIAASERTQRAARVEAQTERLPVLMTLPMILLVVPGTMCLVAGPAFLTAIQGLRALGGGE